MPTRPWPTDLLDHELLTLVGSARRADPRTPNEACARLHAAWRSACELRDELCGRRVPARGAREIALIGRYVELLVDVAERNVRNRVAEAIRERPGFQRRTGMTAEDLFNEAMAVVVDELLPAFDPHEGTWSAWVSFGTRNGLSRRIHELEYGDLLNRADVTFLRRVEQRLELRGVISPDDALLRELAEEVVELERAQRLAAGESPGETEEQLRKNSWNSNAREIVTAWRIWKHQTSTPGSVWQDSDSLYEPEEAYDRFLQVPDEAPEIHQQVSDRLVGKRFTDLLEQLMFDDEVSDGYAPLLEAGRDAQKQWRSALAPDDRSNEQRRLRKAERRSQQRAASPHGQWAYLAELSPQLVGDWA
jgi:hypothetical protein